MAKQLKAACVTIDQQHLLPWLPELKNHVWWASQACSGDADLLVEMVKSMVFHIQNVHSFSVHRQFTRCEHEPFEEYVMTSYLLYDISYH
jgi:hypothetical protein